MIRKTRRSSRIQLDVAVQIEGPGLRCEARSVELGGGGISLAEAGHLPVSLPVKVTFPLPEAGKISIHAVVWWKDGKQIGLRFDPGDAASRLAVERFIEARMAQKE